MRGDEQREWRSTTWTEIDAVLDSRGYRAGFVEVYQEFKGAVLDDEPLDAKGVPKVVTQKNFAKHFGIAVSTFHRWLGEFGDGTEGLSEAARKHNKESSAGAKEKLKDKVKVMHEVRTMVASTPLQFDDKLEVHSTDLSMWLNDCQMLVDTDGMPLDRKASVVLTWAERLEEEVEALSTMRDRLLEWATSTEVEGAA